MRKAAVKRTTKETDVEVARRSRRRRRRRRSRPASAFSTTCSTCWRAIPGSTSRSRPRATCTSTSTTPPRTSASRSARRCKQALGDMKGITRYADVHMPMDEALTRVAIDISGRPFLVFRVEFARDKVGSFDTELVQEWFQAFAMNAGRDPACRDALRHQRSPYRRILLQGSGAGAARRGRDRSAGGRRSAVDQGPARRLERFPCRRLRQRSEEQHGRLHGARAAAAERSRRARRPSASCSCATAFRSAAFLFGPLWMLRHRHVAGAARLCGGGRPCSGLPASVWVGRGRWPRPGRPAGVPDRLRGRDAAALHARPPPLDRNVGVVVGDDLEAAERDSSTSGSAGARRRGGTVRQTSPAPSPGRRTRGVAGPDVIGPVSPARSRRVSVAIVDYGSGNLHSAAKAFERAARECGHEQPIVVTQRSGRGAPRRARGAARRRRLRRLPARPRCGRRHGRGAEGRGCAAGPAVSRHLRRHAAHGRARPRIRGDAGARLDSRRGRPHHARPIPA